MASRKQTKAVLTVTAKRAAQAATQIRPRVQVWLEAGDDYLFGWGICEILLAVRETGAIKDAAAQLGKSYRYVWGRVKDAEATLIRRAVWMLSMSILSVWRSAAISSFIRMVRARS